MQNSRRLAALVAFLLLLLGLAWWLPAYSVPHPELREFEHSAQLIQSLHEKKRAPVEGEWLAKYAEAGQTFIEFVELGHNIPTAKKRTIYVLPIGEFSPAQDQLIDQTTELLSKFFGVPTVRLPNSPMGDLPAEAHRGSVETDDEQVLATHLIDEVLRPKTPPDALACIGLTTHDLWPGPGFNFVFGLAQGECGVWSLSRYGSLDGGGAETLQVRRRLFKVALHETGHMLGIPHCTAYECRMNGTNSIGELDRQPSWFCPECEAKIWWGCRVNRPQRYRTLADFAAREGLREEAEFWSQSAQALEHSR